MLSDTLTPPISVSHLRPEMSFRILDSPAVHRCQFVNGLVAFYNHKTRSATKKTTSMAHSLLHSFATAGYLPWLDLLLESAWVHSGPQLAVRVDALNLDPVDVERLTALYPNLDLRNRRISDAEIAAEIGIAEERLARWKAEIEDTRVSDRNFLYKVFISVNMRYRTMDAVIAEAREAGYGVLVHADADIYLRNDLTQSALVDEMSRHDVGFYVNDDPVSLNHHRKVLGALLAFNLRGNIDPFVERWMAEIDRVPFLNRWKGFGQSVLFYAMNGVDDVAVCDLNSIGDRFRARQEFRDEADMWLGSNTKMISTRILKKLRVNGPWSGAANTRARCRRDLERFAEKRTHVGDEQGQAR